MENSNKLKPSDVPKKMTVKIQNTNIQSGLLCVAIAAKLHGNPISMEQIKHHFGNDKNDIQLVELARIFQQIGFKAKPVNKDISKVPPGLFPIIAELKNGDFVLLGGKDEQEEKILVQRVGEARGSWVKIEELQENVGSQILLLKKQTTKQRSGQQFGLGWFVKSSRKYWTVLRDCLLASFFVQIFGLLSPLIFMIVIDKVLSNNSLSTLDVLVFALVVVSLFEILLNGLRTYLMSHTANRIDLMLGVQLFKHLMSLPLSYFESRQVGDTIARMKELENVRSFITGSGLMLFLDLFFLVVFLFVMYLFSPFLTMLVLVALPFLFGASFLLTPLLRNKLEDRYATGSDKQSFLVETLSGMETIKANAAEPRVREEWEKRLANHVKIGFSGGHLSNLISQSTGLISKILSVLLLWFGAKEVLYGNLTVGQFIAFNMLSSRVIAPILRLSRIWKELQQVNVSVARIGDIFNTAPEPGFDPSKVSLPAIKGDIRFEDVTFRFSPEGAEVLQDVSFSVKAGEIIGIIGTTGSGKTTLVKLLQRLYVPEKGRIFIDGIDISMTDSSWLRRQIGVVIQDGVLFNRSIRDNIALNVPDLDIEEVIAAAKLAGVHDLILGLPEGYDTLVGERGCRLSTGQRQRIAIARALASDPRMLILDEATSGLDYESEMHVQKNMRRICQGRTVFIIAHRLTTIRHADRIISLEHGRIVENDTPQTLLKAGGRFATLQSIHEGHYA